MTSSIDEYRLHAIDQSSCMVNGEAEASNLSYDRLQAAFAALMRDEKRNQLFDLYDDIDPWVQSWAAAHTLELNETKALAKLEFLSRLGIPLLSSSAEARHRRMEEWRVEVCVVVRNA